VIDGEKPRVDSRDKQKHTGRNDCSKDDVDGRASLRIILMSCRIIRRRSKIYCFAVALLVRLFSLPRFSSGSAWWRSG